ncbi:unnamed protein product [Albugo candida]|uniref:RxLR effector protein n=1 Tax=Albugo candida TaxID=65357 RepID=A0A024FUK0_9STRA|nr:unnamed protein product [Albugo candida]|eukprot:CCI10716.1 unnamed protein product [Albugo candida]
MFAKYMVHSISLYLILSLASSLLVCGLSPANASTSATISTASKCRHHNRYRHCAQSLRIEEDDRDEEKNAILLVKQSPCSS